MESPFWDKIKNLILGNYVKYLSSILKIKGELEKGIRDSVFILILRSTINMSQLYYNHDFT